MKESFIAVLAMFLVGCVLGRANAIEEARPSWSLQDDVSSAFGLASNTYEEGLIAFPMKRISKNEAYHQVSARLAKRLSSCNRLIVMQVVTETGEEAESGWLCGLSSERKVQVGKFGVVDGDSFEGPVGRGVEIEVFDRFERELLTLPAIDATRYTTLDSVAVAVTLIREDGVVKQRYFYAPYNIDYDELGNEFASVHEGFDRFYVAMVKILEGVCTSDCFD